MKNIGCCGEKIVFRSDEISQVVAVDSMKALRLEATSAMMWLSRLSMRGDAADGVYRS